MSALEIPKNYGKLLISGVSDPYYLAYRLGKFNIYLQLFRRIETEPKPRVPVLVTVRYEKEEDLVAFIDELSKEAHVRRVFKSGKYFRKDQVNMHKNFLFRVADNLLGLTKGKIIKIKCKDSELRKLFFEVLKEANQKGGFGCTFDYDQYDLEVELRSYNVKNHLWLVVLCDGLQKVVKGQ